MSKQIDYFPTESDLADLFSKAGLPREFSNKFIKDYAAIKRNSTETAGAVDENTDSIEVLDSRVDSAETAISAIEIRVTTAEGEIGTLRIDLDAHVAAESAHGATGNIVGTDDYAQPALGGTVLLAAAVADAVPSAVTPPAAVAAAGAAYSQAYAQAQTDAINALSTALAQAVADFNSVIAQLNALLASERAAKQLAL